MKIKNTVTDKGIISYQSNSDLEPHLKINGDIQISGSISASSYMGVPQGSTLPYDILAIGNINSDGSIIRKIGSFTVNKTYQGVYEINLGTPVADSTKIAGFVTTKSGQVNGVCVGNGTAGLIVACRNTETNADEDTAFFVQVLYLTDAT